MSEDYDVKSPDWELDIPTHGRPKGRSYSPEYPVDTELERPVCKHSDRCVGCPYPNHGFMCWGQDGSCMRSVVARINDIKEKEEKQDDASDAMQS